MPTIIGLIPTLETVMTPFNQTRLRILNDRPVNDQGEYVLYWCQMFRRLRANHALDYAVEQARELDRPLVIYEGLKLNYPWASARFHHFMLEGMRDNWNLARKHKLNYWPFVETPRSRGRGLVKKLCKKACLLVTDDYPQFIVPAQNRAVAGQVDVAVHAVDGNCMVPLAMLGSAVAAAAHIRPRIHKLFAEAWDNLATDQTRWAKPLTKEVEPPFQLWEPPDDLAQFVGGLPIDQSVPILAEVEGGNEAGHRLLKQFVEKKMKRYDGERNQPNDPELNSASGLSAHLHYGHLGIQEVCQAVLGDDWSPKEINPKTRNKDDFFCRDANINSFLDEAITWRDVGYHWHFCRLNQLKADDKTQSWQTEGEQPAFNFQTFDFSPLAKAGTLNQVLPDWAKATLEKHAKDEREYLYSLEQFEAANTHDELWNAAQRELVATGRIHNYLRMLWGKKVLEWSKTPEQGYRVLEHLNNKYAIDGRDPNSYTGILWCFGLFDRPWPPERQIFGNVRFMTSGSTAKKFKLGGYYEYVKSLPKPDEVWDGQTRRKSSGRLFE